MNILLVDDHTLFREGLASLLDSQPGLTIVGLAESVQNAIVKANELQPDLILMDFGLPDGTGLDAARPILDKYPAMKIVFLTMNEDDERLSEAIQCGGKGYMLKNVPVAKLLSYVYDVLQDETVTIPASERTGKTGALSSNSSSVLDVLTHRERDVFQVLRIGETNRQIAERLALSERVVKNHVNSILVKLNLKNRYEAATFALENDLIDS